MEEFNFVSNWHHEKNSKRERKLKFSFIAIVVLLIILYSFKIFRDVQEIGNLQCSKERLETQREQEIKNSFVKQKGTIYSMDYYIESISKYGEIDEMEIKNKEVKIKIEFESGKKYREFIDNIEKASKARLIEISPILCEGEKYKYSILLEVKE